MRAAETSDHSAPTPCSEYDVRALLDRLAVWIQVFDAAVNDGPVGFDPASEEITAGWSAVIDGLRSSSSGVCGPAASTGRRR